MTGSALILVFQAMQTYIIDAFTLHAASGLRPTLCFLYTFILICFFNFFFLYSTCSNGMSAVTNRLWISSFRSSHVRKTWIWEGRYDSCLSGYRIRVPRVRPSHLFFFVFLIADMFDFSSLHQGLFYSGSMVVGYD